MQCLSLTTQKVTKIDITVNRTDCDKLLEWFYSMGGRSLSTGPVIKKDFQIDFEKFHLVGFIEDAWSQQEVEAQLSK